MASDVEVLFGADASELSSTVDDVKDKLGEVGEHAHEASEEGKSAFEGLKETLESMKGSIENVVEALGGFKELMIEAFAVHEIEEGVEKIKEFAEEMAHLGFETEKAMEILGTSSSEVAGLQAVAAATGSSLGSLEQQMSRAFRNIVNGSKQAKEAAAYFGLSLQELAHMPMEEALGKIADAYAALPPGIQRTAEAQALLGRGATALAPILAQGAAGLEEFNAMAQRAGTVLSEDMLAQMHATHEAMTELRQASIGLGEAVYGVFQGSITGAIQIMVDLVESLTSSISSSTELRAVLFTLNAALGGLEIVVAEVIAIFKDLWDAGDAAIQSLAAGFEVLAETVAEVFKPIKESIEAAYDLMTGDFADALAHSKTAAGGIDTSKITQDWADAAEKTKKVWEDFHNNETHLNADLTKEIKAIGGAVDETKTKTDKSSEATAELRKQWQTVIDGMKGSGSALDELNSKIETLKEALGQAATAGQDLGDGMKATGSAADMIKGFEGYKDKAYWDVNHWRVGYGSDTTTDTSGKSHEVTESTTTTREDAERDLARRITDIQTQAAKQIGDAWQGLSDRAKASISSVAYNYGHVPSEVVAAARTGDESKIAGAIGGLSSNPDRRRKEAENITAKGPGISMTPEEKKKSEDDLAELTKKRDELMKGSPRDQAEAKALDDQIKGHGDVIKAKEAEIAADKQMLAGETDLEKKRKDQKQLEEDTLALGKLKTSSKEADLNREKAGAKGDPEAEHKAATGLAQLKMDQAKALYGVDSAEYKNAVKEKEDADRAFTASSNALTKERIDEDMRAAKSSADEQRKALDDALSHKRISADQWLSSTNAINEAEKTSVKKLYDEELAMADQSARDKVAIKNKEADQLREINNKEADDARKAADASAKSYESMANTITGTFTTAIKGMVTGHETFRQAAQKAMEGLANKTIDLVGQMVAKWLAGEMAKTAATTTGTAARTAAEQAGGAAGAVGQIAGILKSIFASAGQAFAGVFGFLAPVMGPAAAGPAAAAEATVVSVGSGLASADIGMWNVPNDQLAMIHKSELVMPAAQAGAFRNMLSGSNAGGGAGGGVNVNPSLNMHLHALDGDSVKSFMRNNQRQIMQSMNSSVRSGAHLGLKALT